VFGSKPKLLIPHLTAYVMNIEGQVKGQIYWDRGDAATGTSQ
jgi:hypothetical protein